ncbi:MAG: amidohydrolase family protein [Bacteroidia bacterium]|nr:amidohydrolase family protein [Bacteroidia bacterium]
MKRLNYPLSLVVPLKMGTGEKKYLRFDRFPRLQTISLFALLLPFLLHSQPTLRISNCRIVDPISGKVTENQDIIVEGDEIKRIIAHRDRPSDPNEKIFDAAGKWVIPGLTDAHVHFFQSGGLYARPDIIDLRERVSVEEERRRVMALAPDFMARYLSCGITSVCDMGGPFTNFDIRAMAAASDSFPDVYTTGPLISSYQPEEFGDNDPPILKVTTPEEAREKVRAQIPQKPDYIKIWYIVRRGEKPEQFLPIVEAVIEESHKHEIPVAVHATQRETARLAVKAGADILVHSVDDQVVDQAFIDLLKEKKVSYIPTLSVNENYTQALGQHWAFRPEDFEVANPFTLGSLTDIRQISPKMIPLYVQNMMAQPFVRAPKVEIMYENLRKLHEGGINIVTGTDAGNIGTLHASSFYEEIIAMNEAGLSPLEVLRASTFNGARMFGKEKKQGTVEVGKRAELVILEENPLENIQNLRRVTAVVFKGKIQVPDSLRADTPEEIVQRQLNAWNLKNAEVFADCFDENVEVFRYPHEKMYQGKKNLYDRYKPFFEENPQAHCERVNRIRMGNIVIDEEKITGLANGNLLRALAIYEVVNGKIVKITFVFP